MSLFPPMHPKSESDAQRVVNLTQKAEFLKSQIDRLTAFIMEEVPGEPSQSEGAVDTAIRVIRELRAWKNERTCFGIQEG